MKPRLRLPAVGFLKAHIFARQHRDEVPAVRGLLRLFRIERLSIGVAVINNRAARRPWLCRAKLRPMSIGV